MLFKQSRTDIFWYSTAAWILRHSLFWNKMFLCFDEIYYLVKRFHIFGCIFAQKSTESVVWNTYFDQCWSPDIRIIRNPDIFGQFDRPKIDAPNSDIRIVKKTLFLEHFFIIFTFLHGILFLWILFSNFAPFLLYKKAAKNEEKI